jgi:hypothetical protein
MNKGLFFSMVTITLITISTNSFASKPSYYLGVGVGQSSFEFNEPNIIADYSQLTATSRIKDDATAFSFYGGIPFDEYLSLEFDFVLTGDISAKEANLNRKLFDVSTLAITAMLSKPLSENSRFFGRLGAHLWDISESSGELDTINNAVDLTFGFGIDINVYGDRSRQLRVQWNHYEYDGIYLDDSDLFSVSLLFELGGY